MKRCLLAGVFPAFLALAKTFTLEQCCVSAVKSSSSLVPASPGQGAVCRIFVEGATLCR